MEGIERPTPGYPFSQAGRPFPRISGSADAPPLRPNLSFFGKKNSRYIRPDPNESLRGDSSARDWASSISSCEDADEEIFRPNLQSHSGLPRAGANLQSRSGPPRAQPFQDFLQKLSSRSPASRSAGNRFPGVTMNSTTTSAQTKPSDIGDLVRQLLEDGPTDLADLLRSKDKKPERKVRSEWTPLHFAAQKGSPNLCQALLEKGADVNSREDDDWTPLMFAAQNGHVDACRVLLDNKADVNAAAVDNRNALFQASQNGHPEVVKLLISTGADIHAQLDDGTTPLFMAEYMYCVKNKPGCLGVVSSLLKAGANPNIGDTLGLHPLFIACLHGKPEMVQLLLEHHADPNVVSVRGKNCLGAASSEANPETVRLLLQNGAHVHGRDDRDWTALHMVTQHDKPGTLEVAQLLVDAGVDIDAQCDGGATGLYLAVQAKRADVAEFLIRAGANVDLATLRGMNPLFRAVADSNLDIVNMLLESGAKTGLISTNGLSLAHFAALQEDAAVVRRILDMGVELDIVSTDDHKIRPIHLACQNDNEEIAIIFLQYDVKA